MRVLSGGNSKRKLDSNDDDQWTLIKNIKTGKGLLPKQPSHDSNYFSDSELDERNERVMQTTTHSTYNQLRGYLNKSVLTINRQKHKSRKNEDKFNLIEKNENDNIIDEDELNEGFNDYGYDKINAETKNDENIYDQLNITQTNYNLFNRSKSVVCTSAVKKRESVFTQTVKRKLTYKNGEQQQQQQQQQQQACNASSTGKVTCLTEIKPSSLFATQSDGVFWYFSLLSDTMIHYIKECKQFDATEQAQRINMINAHQLYAKNLYEVRLNTSRSLSTLIKPLHPCVIAMACLLDSDAICICDNHNCSFDSYVYLFSTKIKFCAWKTKYYIILKKPKRSSLERLNLIENLINCHKLLNDRSIV